MLSTDRVTFKYPQDKRGLQPISLEAMPGEIILVTGPSGSGKSTLARCLIGLIPHLYHGEFSGEVRLNGYRTTDVAMWQLAEKGGMLFQNPASQMLTTSVEEEVIFGLENLGLGRDVIVQRLETVLHQFGLSDLRLRSPQTLSGGEQQKLALAAIVARQPDVLILDEPLSMLDTTAASELIAHLKQLADMGKTVLIFEHRQEFLEGLEGLRVLALPRSFQSRVTLSDDVVLPTRERFELVIERLHVSLGGRAVLRNFNLSLKSGEWVAVVGRNGVGKTTLLRALAGLQKFEGRVNAVSRAGKKNPDFGMIFQNPDLQLFNPTVREEILYRIPDPDSEFYDAIVKSLGLQPYEETPPLLLSEGEKKRVALAMVLMQQPAHGILLDEPSLGQDSTHKATLSRILRMLADTGQLIMMTTHDLMLASQADRLILLGCDGVLADGKTKTVLHDEKAWQHAGILLPDWFRRHISEDVVS
jgi:energy-coupling factor transport system ATP-binding protein